MEALVELHLKSSSRVSCMQPVDANGVAQTFLCQGDVVPTWAYIGPGAQQVLHTSHRCLRWCLPVWLQVLCPVPAGAHSRQLPAGEGTPCPVDEVSDPGPRGLCEV